MFGESVKKNRRLTPREFEWELWQAKAFHRRPRLYLYDKPSYDWLPITPLVNFDLGYNNKGQH